MDLLAETNPAQESLVFGTGPRQQLRASRVSGEGSLTSTAMMVPIKDIDGSTVTLSTVTTVGCRCPALVTSWVTTVFLGWCPGTSRWFLPGSWSTRFLFLCFTPTRSQPV